MEGVTGEQLRLETNVKDNLILIGPMAAGKTTIGRLLAAKLGLTFFDCDREIEASTGVDIVTIFEFEGESGFRVREAQMLARLCATQHVVLATGGGAILNAENREVLAKTGTVIFLDLSLSEQLARTCLDKKRPLLQTNDPTEKLKQLAMERKPLYLSIADVHVCTDGLSPQTTCQKILELLAKQPETQND